MKFTFIRSYKKISSLIDGPYNDPENENDYNEEEFDREYEQVRSGLQSIVNTHCDTIGVPRSTISVGHRTGPSRGIGLVVEENALIRLTDMIMSVQSYLRSLLVDYCVSVNIVIDEYGDFRDLNIGITKSDEVLVHADNAKWFREVGINAD